ncbi:MAG: LCP family protein [Clostridia bacterium]|nr:LCP family protein [Clostridia bacterium]
MSKISERRERTANTKIENKAYLAEAPAQKKEYMYKKVLIALLAIVAVVACVLLMLNAVIDAQAKKFVNAPAHTDAVATAPVTGSYYEKTDYLLDTCAPFRNAYQVVIDNANRTEVLNKKSDENVFNFVFTINDSVKDADSGNVVMIMLLSFNKAEDKVTYVYINKATFALIPSVGIGPLFDAYAFGGGALLSRAIEANYGITVDGYADLSLDTFVTASAEIGGITINDTAYETKDEIYDYVEKATDREAATKNVVSALAQGTKEQKLFGASKVALKIVESAKANINRDDVGELLQMGVGVFKAEPTVELLGYDTAEAIIYTNTYENLYLYSIFDYEGEITKIQNLLYPVAE